MVVKSVILCILSSSPLSVIREGISKWEAIMLGNYLRHCFLLILFKNIIPNAEITDFRTRNFSSYT